MKKIIWLILSILIVGTIAVIFPFTSIGNSIISSNVESYLKEQTKLDVTFKEFNLNFSDVNISLQLESSKIDVSGVFDIFKKSLDFKYLVDLKDLSKFDKLVGRKLHGSLYTNGTVDGTFESIKVLGFTNFARSKTDYRFTTEDKVLNVVSKSLHLEDVLYTVDQPTYIVGAIDLFMKLKDFEGDIVTKIYESYLNSKALNLPETIYIKNGYVVTNLSKESAKSKIDIYSSIANIHSKSLNINLKTSQIDGDYLLNIYDFSKLNKFADRKLRGETDITGEVHKGKELLVTGKSSNFLDGKLEFALKNSILMATIEKLRIKSALHSIYQAEIFDAELNSELLYSIDKKVGEFKAISSKGQFEESDFTRAITTLTGLNLTKEIYSDIKLNTKIANDKLLSNLDMKSNNTNISSQNSIIDLKKSLIDTDINVSVKNGSVVVNLSGDLKSPKVSIDPTEYLKHRAIKEIKKALPSDFDKKVEEKSELLNQKIDEKLEKVLPAEVRDLIKGDLQNGINNLKNLFQ